VLASVQLVIRNRAISEADLGQIRDLIQCEGEQGRSHLSRVLCQRWDWRQANGAYREIACRDLLRRLDSRGLVQLPSPLKAARRPGYQNKVPALTLDRSPVTLDLAAIHSELALAQVRGTAAEKLFNGLIQSYHYLGFQQPSGPSLKYVLFWQNRPLACASFGSAAWMVASRDRYIGWSSEQRDARRHEVVNNDRFLILPWARVAHLASHTLARIGRQLAQDWQAAYSQTIVLAETFVDGTRFAGTCYAAARWICVGHTQGRGRNQQSGEAAVPIKSVWLYPLARDFQRRLCA
jgi:Domain of unknown function (DUF4338)